MYSMSWAPFTCCSIDAATDCDTTSALAPGKTAFTVTWGGTTCGYWAIGSPTAASAPTRIMSSAMTVEKTGRSMKKLSIGRFRLHLHAGTDLADAFHNDPLSGVQAACDYPVVVEAVAGHDLPRLDLVAGGDHVHRFQSLQLLHCLLRNADCRRALERSDANAHEEAGSQQAFRIGHRDAHLQRAALLVERGIDEIEPSADRVLAAVGEAYVERRCLIGLPHRLLDLQQPVLADREVHPHRVAGVQRGEQRLLRRDQRAGLHLRAAHEALARRSNGGEFEVELAIARQGLLRLDQRGARALLRHGGVVILLADRLLGDQARIARQVLLGVDQVRLGLRQARFRLRRLCFERALVDDVEKIALFHPRAVGKGLALEQAGDLGTDLDRVGRLRLRDVLVIDGDRARLHLDHRHLGGWGTLRVSLALAAAQHGGSDAERERPARKKSQSTGHCHTPKCLPRLVRRRHMRMSDVDCTVSTDMPCNARTAS